MDNIQDYETENLFTSLDADRYELNEKLWYECFESTDKGPYSYDSNLHRLLKCAYQMIKVLEKENKELTRKLEPYTKVHFT